MIRQLSCPYFAPAEVKAVWDQWTIPMQEAWLANNMPKPKSKLLRHKAESKFESLAPVAVEIFVHGDQVPQVIADVSGALQQGLVPVSFALINNAVVLRLERNESRKPLQGE